MTINPSIYAIAQAEADRRRQATSDEAIAELGLVTACRINFVPAMLGAVQLDALLQLCDRARELRLSEIKPETRELRRLCDAWGKALSSVWSREGAAVFNACIEAFGEFTEIQRWIAFQKLRVDAMARTGADPDTAAWCEWFRLLDRERSAFEAKMDEQYPRYINVNFRNSQRIVMLHANKHIGNIRRKGYAIEASPEALPAPGVIRNKAWELAEKIADQTYTLDL